MRFISILAIPLFAAIAFGKTIKVDVGADGLVYAPDIIVAAVDDQVQFTFFPSGHSVTQSDFSSPCNPNGGINSGLVFVNSGSSNQVFVVDIKDTSPIWLYCALDAHCQSGMVAVINPPSGGNTLDSYKANARNANSGVAPSSVAGGSFVTPGSSSSTTSISASSTTSISASSTASSSASSASHSSASSATSSSTHSTPSSSVSSATSKSSSTGTTASSVTTEAGTTTPAATSATKTGGAATAVANHVGALMSVLFCMIGLLL